ncbi:MAG: hypothetical protein EOO41_05740, partial [Methanobacteriota archaeon]
MATPSVEAGGKPAAAPGVSVVATTAAATGGSTAMAAVPSPVLAMPPSPVVAPSGAAGVGGGTGGLLQTVALAHNNVFQFSRSDSLATVQAKLGAVLRIAPQRLRLWMASMSQLHRAVARGAQNVAGLSRAARTEAAQRAAALALWPFVPLFGLQVPAEDLSLSELDLIGPDGAVAVVDPLMWADGQWTSAATGYAALYFTLQSSAPGVVRSSAHVGVAGASTSSSASGSASVAGGSGVSPTHRSAVSGPEFEAAQVAGSIMASKPYVYPGALSARWQAHSRPGVDSSAASQNSVGGIWSYSRRPSALVGLANLGNTCYLNGALQ